MSKDREITTTTFTTGSLAAAKSRLEEELDTGIVVEPHPVSKGFHNWAAKFARAWGTMLENEDGTVFVEVTTGTPLGLDPVAVADTMDTVLEVPVWLNRALTRRTTQSSRGDLEIALKHLDNARLKLTYVLALTAE